MILVVIISVTASAPNAWAMTILFQDHPLTAPFGGGLIVTTPQLTADDFVLTSNSEVTDFHFHANSTFLF